MASIRDGTMTSANLNDHPLDVTAVQLSLPWYPCRNRTDSYVTLTFEFSFLLTSSLFGYDDGLK
jgi:hypothetical protein